VAEISGIVQQAELEIGDRINQGANLVSIKPQDFSLEVSKQQANLALVTADLNIKKSIYNRYPSLRLLVFLV
jgi:multidrug resistance efflux pump